MNEQIIALLKTQDDDKRSAIYSIHSVIAELNNPNTTCTNKLLVGELLHAIAMLNK
jgi:hypothetical protein